MIEEFVGRGALITGGASGIGLGIAEALAERGIAVMLADMDLKRAETEAARLREAGHKARAQFLDVRDAASWTAALDACEAAFGPLAMLFSNAGVTGSVLPIAESEVAGWRFTLDVDLDGCFLGARLGVPRLLAHGRPGYFNATASLGGLQGFATNGAYAAAKAGVIAMCEALKDELKETPVAVSILCPGLVNTRIHESSEELSPGGIALGGHSTVVREMGRQAIPARDVGEMVIKGVNDGLFWIFTTPDARHMIQAKTDLMLGNLEALFGKG